jgi:uncharacterized membrane protein
VWFVRIGIGVLLTGIIFLGSYTYQNFIIHWEAGSRVFLMYAISAVLTGLGLLLERSRHELRNYGRVVCAGGFAALYYTTYAAHHVEALKVISHPVTAALLLTGCAALFFGYAAWRKSPTLTLAALILGYYGIAINPLGSLGCFAGFLLSAVGMFFFLRKSWMRTGFTALAGAYGSYAYWQGLVHSGGDDASRWFLLAYWVLFTAACLAPGTRRIEDRIIACFVGLNNILAFLLFAADLRFLHWHPDLGRLALGFGGILLLLAILLTRYPSHPAVVRRVYLAQGLALVTWGLTIELSGYHLFLALAIEAALLAFFWQRFRGILLHASTVIVAVLAGLVALREEFFWGSDIPTLVWIACGLAFATSGWLMRESPYRDPDSRVFYPTPLFFAIMALGLPLLGILHDYEPAEAGLWMLTIGSILGGAAVLLQRRWPVPELGWVAQPYAVLGALKFIVGDASTTEVLAALGLLCGLSHLHAHFPRDAEETYRSRVSRPFEFVFGALLTAVLAEAILTNTVTRTDALFAMALLPLALHLGATGTRCRGIALTSPFLYLPVLFLATGQTLGSLFGNRPELTDPASLSILLAALGATGHFVVLTAWTGPAGREMLREILFPLGGALWFGWVLAAVDHPQILLALTGLGLVFLRPDWRVSLQDAVMVTFLLAGLALAASNLSEPFWARYLALPPAFVAHFWLTRETAATDRWKENRLETLAIPASLALTMIVSHQTLETFDGKGLAVAWALLAVFFFATGFGLQRRLYRWAALVMLAATLGHVFAVDVWKLDTLMRIVSFLTLGVVFLALGFVYNRWADRIRRLL